MESSEKHAHQEHEHEAWVVCHEQIDPDCYDCEDCLLHNEAIQMHGMCSFGCSICH